MEREHSEDGWCPACMDKYGREECIDSLVRHRATLEAERDALRVSIAGLVDTGEVAAHYKALSITFGEQFATLEAERDAALQEVVHNEGSIARLEAELAAARLTTPPSAKIK